MKHTQRTWNRPYITSSSTMNMLIDMNLLQCMCFFLFCFFQIRFSLTITGRQITIKNQSKFFSKSENVIWFQGEIENIQLWGTSTFTASPVFAPSAEWKNESRCGCCWHLLLLLFDGVLLWWRHGGRWVCTTVGLYLIYLPPQLPAFTDDGNEALLMLRELSSLLLLLYYCIDLSIFASVNGSEKWEDPASSHVSLYHDPICTTKINFLDMVCLHHFISCQLFPLAANENTIKARWVLMKQKHHKTHKYNRLDS